MKVKRWLNDVVCVCFKFDGLGKIGESDSLIFIKKVDKIDGRRTKSEWESNGRKIEQNAWIVSELTDP